jgi:hypothetical protein
MVGVSGKNFTLRVGNPTETLGFANNVIAESTAVVVTQVVTSGQAAKSIVVTASDLTGSDSIDEELLTLAITSPVLTETYQYDVFIKYKDGSQSETERVTFVKSANVTASVTLTPAVVGGASTTLNSFTLNGINTENFLKSNSQAAAPGGSGAATATNFGVAATVGGSAMVTSAFTYVELTDSYTFTITDTFALDDVILVSVNLWNTASVDANTYFDSTKTTVASSSQAKFTLASVTAYNSMDIAVASSTSVVHNKNAVQATGSAVPAETVIALAGTKSLNFVISAFTDGATRSVASSSGIPVTITLSDNVGTDNDLGTTTITAGGKSLNVAGSSISFTLITNSSGQVAFTVTADNAVAGESFHIDALGSLVTANNVTVTQLDRTLVEWAKASFSLLPAVDGDFSIAPGGSLAVDYVVVDQFGNLAGANYQLAMTRVANSAVAANRDKAAEYASWSYVAPVSATGRASATIVDNGLAATEGSDTVTVSLQKAATAGGAFIAEANSTADTFVLTYENDLAALTSTAKVNYNGIANAAGAGVAPILIEPDTLVDYDARTTALRPTKFDVNNFKADGSVVAAAGTDTLLRVFGTVVTTGNAPVAGVAVSLSAAGLNFADKSTVAAMTRASNDSIVVFTDATGSYEAFVRSATTGNVTIAVNAQGAKSSVEVRFQTSTGVATGLTLAGPSSVASGARGDFVATVVDKFGKPVSGVSVTFKDNGPGVLNVTSAVTTDAFGEAQATLTTLAAESGTTVVTAYATIGGVLVTQTATVVVGKAAATSSDVVVNVGTFSGKLVVYALNAAGSEVSYKIAGKWVTQVVTSDLLQRYDRVVGATGATIKVDIYVDGVLKVAKSVVTK